MSVCSKIKEVEERSRNLEEQKENLKKELEEKRRHSDKGDFPLPVLVAFISCDKTVVSMW